MKFALLTLVLAMAGSAFAVDFPAKWQDFEKVSYEEMKKYPDVKWTAAKKVTATDIANKSETELVLLKNSIYAQHGFRFAEKTLANYFLGRSWYRPVQEWDVNKLDAVSRENVQLIMGSLASMKGEGRTIASEATYIASQVSYNLFLMGFCTYSVGSDAKAGLVVFEPGGVAKVFHSSASRSQFAPYAYEGYANESWDGASLLIPAAWSVKVSKQRAEVQLDYNPADLAQFRDEAGKPIIAAGKRLLLSVNTASSNPYGFVRNRQCSMSIVK